MVLLLAGCAARETTALVASPGTLPGAAQVAGVPFFAQADKACGPASLAMAMVWAGRPASPEHLSSQVYTPGRDGSLASDMMGAARRQGMLAVPVKTLAALLGELAAGHPVVVFQNLSLALDPVWHFAVATGYDLPAREIILHSGLDADLRMRLDTFEHTWERSGRWAMVVLLPDRLPATAPELEIVMAAAGLERAERAPAAGRAYEAILERWPDNVAAMIGVGNAQYAQGDLATAERSFRKAVNAHPDSAPAWNNLAQVLMERGILVEARFASDMAQALDAGSPIYAATSEELRRAETADAASRKAR